MSELVVFLSSVMDPTKDNLAEERSAAKNAIEALHLTKAWRFEDSPASSLRVDYAYLNRLAQADIFLMILAKEITAPVRREYEVAAEAGKPRLVFLKKVERSSELQTFIKQIDVKWKEFSDAANMQQEIIAGLSEELINGYRSRKIQLAAADLRKLESLQLKTPAAAAPSSVNLGPSAQISHSNVAGRDQKIVEIRRAGRDYFEARGQAQIHVTYDSSSEDVLQLLETMKAAVDELDMPLDAKKKVKYALDGAKLETESKPANREGVAEKLKEAANIVKNTTNLALEATSFGKLLANGLVWVGKTVSWLAL